MIQGQTPIIDNPLLFLKLSPDFSGDARDRFESYERHTWQQRDQMSDMRSFHERDGINIDRLKKQKA